MYSYSLIALAALVQANPLLVARQGVTAALSPSAPAPPGCTGSVDYSFGIVANNVSDYAVAKRQATQIQDGQVQAAKATAKAVSQITDGQVQAATGAGGAVSQITDGQIQAPTSAPKIMTVAPISMYTDGQVQAGLHTMNMMAVATPAAAPAAAVSQIGDGQVQAPANQASQINDGQIQAPAATTIMPVTESKDGQPVAPTMPAVSQKTNSQPIAPTSAQPAISTVVKASTGGSPASTASSAPAATSSGSNTSLVTCKGGPSFTLDGTKIVDQNGRTGYIASNFQFQFDSPPQAGALFTTGFSICANGTLALGGSNIFYQCLSGNFYNLYDRSWAAQCSPAYIETLQQIDC